MPFRLDCAKIVAFVWLWTSVLLAVPEAIAASPRACPQALAAPERVAPAPSLPPLIDRADSLPEQFIVVFGGGMSGPRVGAKSAPEIVRAREAVKLSGDAEKQAVCLGGHASVVGYRYRWALIGFSVALTRERLQELRKMPGISWIETDGQVQAPLEPVLESDRALHRFKAGSSASYAIQYGVPAGLDRIGQRSPILNGQYAYSLDGAGVHIYVVDTGILATHIDFGARVLTGRGQWFNATGDNLGVEGCGTRSHGTRVAGIIAGEIYGVAKKAVIHPVRVFTCEDATPNATILAGVDWITEHRVTSSIRFPAIANLSLESRVEYSQLSNDSLYFAVNNSINDADITYVVAAGNDSADACSVTPARVHDAITVGNSYPWGNKDHKKDSSNFGKCVDLFASGENILSASNGSPTDKSIRPGGTSMAAAHVTGVAALYLQRHPLESHAQVWAAIRAVANDENTKDWCGVVDRGADSPNVLLHWGGGADDGKQDVEPEPQTPPC